MYWNSEQTQLEMQMTSLKPKRFAAIQLWLKAIKWAPPPPKSMPNEGGFVKMFIIIQEKNLQGHANMIILRHLFLNDIYVHRM